MSKLPFGGFSKKKHAGKNAGAMYSVSFADTLQARNGRANSSDRHDGTRELLEYAKANSRWRPGEYGLRRRQKIADALHPLLDPSIEKWRPLAAGAHSKPLAAQLGSNVPLETERGYHVMLESPSVTPRIPVCSGEGKYFMTPMEGGLRVAGTVELGGLEAAPNYPACRFSRSGRQAAPPRP